MSSAKKSVLLSALCVAVAALLLGYSGYGWMTMSRQVRAIGQNVSIAVPENLQISLSGTDGSWSDSVTVELKYIVEKITENDTSPNKPFNPDQGEGFYLLPASSYNGTNHTIWQTGSAKHDGSPADGAVFEEGHRILWNASTSSFEGHYIDVPLYFRTDGETELRIALSQTTTSITSGDTSDIDKVVRVAFLNDAGTASSMGDEEPLVFASPNSTGVFNGVVRKDATHTISPQYLRFTNTNLQQLFTVTPREVTKITVRIWVEGQDVNCVAKIGGKQFSVSLGFCVIE